MIDLWLYTTLGLLAVFALVFLALCFISGRITEAEDRQAKREHYRKANYP